MTYTISPDTNFLERVQPVVATALEECEAVLPPFAQYDVITNYTDDEFTLEHMHGCVGYTGNEEGCVLFINTNVRGWQETLRATVAHEYNHIVWYQHKQTNYKEISVQDNIALEGLAQCFEESVTGKTPHYAQSVSADVVQETLEKLKPHFEEPSQGWMHAWVGGSDEFETWAGYTLSYMLVKPTVEHTKLSWRELMKLAPAEVLVSEVA